MWTEERLDELVGVRSEMWEACSNCLPRGVSVHGSTFVFLGQVCKSEVRTESAKQQEETLLSR